MSDIAVTVTLTSSICYSGYVWVGPVWTTPVTCPYCAEAKLAWVRSELASVHKQIASLRGQITKLKRGRRV